MLRTELQHRVRNTLSIIRSIARRTAENSDGLDDFMAHFEGRLAALARTLAHIPGSPGGGADLAAILSDELLAHQAREGDNVTCSGPPVQLAAKSAATIGVALHELVTNAVKFGALGTVGGRQRVEWTLAGAGLRIVWEEYMPEGGVAPPDHAGFGSEMLAHVLPYELDAVVTTEWRPAGLHVVIELPLTPA